MAGETSIDILLKNIQPELQAGEYVFVTSTKALQSELLDSAVMIFKEAEGSTFIVEKTIADSYGFAYEATWSMITLTIHSDLQAVGFLAAITKVLADNNISVNAVSAYYHDHLFVTTTNTQKTLEILSTFSDPAN